MRPLNEFWKDIFATESYVSTLSEWQFGLVSLCGLLPPVPDEFRLMYRAAGTGFAGADQILIGASLLFENIPQNDVH